MTLRIQLASDLHLEFLDGPFAGERLISPAADADLLVLAGDISNGLRGIASFANWPTPVLYLLGNHEAYGHELNDLRRQMKRECAGTSVQVLDNDAADLSKFDGWYEPRKEVAEKVRIFGCTLWTDYRYRCNRTQSQVMDSAAHGLNDHRLIRIEGGRFLPQHALAEHLRSRAWLEQRLQEPFDGRTVVITHHGPHPLSVHPRYSGDPINGAFVSDLGDLMPSADLWLHGHVHDNFDYQVGRCRVVANPRGYALNRHRVEKASELEFENARFLPQCVIEA